jgi:rRNA maturation endonuclease Nob1
MTIYECHGCGKLYDDEKGMPIRCCGKIIRHIHYTENYEESEELY